MYYSNLTLLYRIQCHQVSIVHNLYFLLSSETFTDKASYGDSQDTSKLSNPKLNQVTRFTHLTIVHEWRKCCGKNRGHSRTHQHEPSQPLHDTPVTAIMPEQIHKVHRSCHEEQMLRAQQACEHNSPGKITPLLEKVQRKQQQPHEESIILEVDMVNSEQRRRP